MSNFKNVKKMGLGNLIAELRDLKISLENELADENSPYPKREGAHNYNARMVKEYGQREKELVKELNSREEKYKRGLPYFEHI